MLAGYVPFEVSLEHYRHPQGDESAEHTLMIQWLRASAGACDSLTGVTLDSEGGAVVA